MQPVTEIEYRQFIENKNREVENQAERQTFNIKKI